MEKWMSPRERTLGPLTLVLGVIVWLLLIVGTMGMALLALALGFVIYLFAQSALIARLRGNGVALSAEQFPDLHRQFADCCERLHISPLPQAYVMPGHGAFNAFATQFLGTRYVVLYSEVVDAMAAHPDGVRFYIGHELGHLRLKHISGHLLRWPVLWLPLLGAAYSRARESSCDRHGRACCASAEGAARSMALLAAGAHRWQDIDIAAYRSQAMQPPGFWMSLHELMAGYPWTAKRAARMVDLDTAFPSRNPLAYLLAIFVPYTGRLGAGFGFLMLVYIIGVLAAVALPAYEAYQTKARLAGVIVGARPALDRIGRYYTEHQEPPATLEGAGVAPQLPDGSKLELDPSHMTLTVQTDRGALVFTPSEDAQHRVTWECGPGEGLKPAELPPGCRMR